MGLDEPICGVGGTRTTCAEHSNHAGKCEHAAVSGPTGMLEGKKCFHGIGFLAGLAKMPPNIARKLTDFLHKMIKLIKFMDNVII